MKPSEIRVGETYLNRSGTTWRKVIGIGDEYRPKKWRGGLSHSRPPTEPGVLYVDSHDYENRLYLSSFASWAGGIKQ
jgi:hypothetical protein